MKTPMIQSDRAWWLLIPLGVVAGSLHAASPLPVKPNQLWLQYAIDGVPGNGVLDDGSELRLPVNPVSYLPPAPTLAVTTAGTVLRQFHLINEPSMRPETEVKVNRGNGTSEESAAWLPCKPTTGNRFTAVGLYFGRKLQLETGVPIGLIKTAWNGPRIEPWISPAGLASVKELPPVTGLPAEYKSDGSYPSTWHCLYNGKIHPLIRYGIKGAIWYQGESNGDEGETYYQKLRALIGGWLYNHQSLPASPFRTDDWEK
ncbi:MAG: hypothetical protein NTW21_04480 [Verrucomicrobia bacterium]|nr:hypothetical protein [Verrucomicrobiota bacterium]